VLDAAVSQVASNPAGRISLDRQAYMCADVIRIRVRDSNAEGPGSVGVAVATTRQDREVATLSETSSGTGRFEGSISTAPGVVAPVDDTVQVADGDIVTVSYDDADDGTGIPTTVEVTATVDCVPPAASGVATDDIGGSGARVTVGSNEPTTVTVRFGTSCGSLTAAQPETRLDTSHDVELTGLTDGTEYFYAVELSDAAGNTTTDDNGGACYRFATIAFGPPMALSVGAGSHLRVLPTAFGFLEQTASLSGSLSLRVGDADASGVRPVMIPRASVHFAPIPIQLPPVAWGCLELKSDALGTTDCDGGSTGRDLMIRLDHNTTPGDPGNGQGGLPDDPACDASATFRGTTVHACQEGTACKPGASHFGVCNSPMVTLDAGTLAAGDATASVTIGLTLLTDEAAGGDGVPCTSDDAAPLFAIDVPFHLTTGHVDVTLFDTDNFGNLITEFEETGAPLDCAGFDGSVRLVGGVSLLDQFIVPGFVSDLLATLVLDLVPGPTPTPTVAPSCSGDCNGDQNVTISEVIFAVNIALGLGDPEQCAAVDQNQDLHVTIAELIAAILNALTRCPGAP
jgi:hypothetical protein